MHRQAFEPDHKQSNPLFASWKLSKALSVAEHTVSLRGQVTSSDHSTDYINTRAAVLHNHINHQHGHMYLFRTVAGSLTLQKICLSHPTTLQAAWEPSQAVQNACASQCKDGERSLQPSVVEVQPLDQTLQDRQLLISSGQGDLFLVSPAEPTVSIGPCFPLKLDSPSHGAQCLHLEAAHQSQPGQIELVAWAIRKKSAAESAACQVYCITLLHQAGQLSVEDTQLLQVCALPPHSVTQPNKDTIILATSDPAASQPDTQSAVTASAKGSSAHDDDGDDISPRTLRQAADRLAKFTSDQPADALQQNEYADLYSEVGPDNVGGMGNEPSCTLTLFRHGQSPAQLGGASATNSQPTGTKHNWSSTAIETAVDLHNQISPAWPQDTSVRDAAQRCEDQHATDKLQPSGMHVIADRHRKYEAVMQIGCSPHDVVAIQSGHQDPMLLGLSNDVDCAVVAVSAVADGQQLQAQHVHSIPALAYVAAGKIHKKFVLLAHPSSSLAAAVIEGHRFSYVYRKTAQKQGSGESQIIDMGLQQNAEAVLGAALSWENGQDVLLILTERQLRTYSIQVL